MRTRERLQELLGRATGRLLDGQLEGLSAVAQLVAQSHARGRGAELCACLLDERVALGLQAICGERGARQHHGARGVTAGSGGGEAERAEHAGGARAEHALDPQLGGHRGRVQGPGTAEWHQHEGARIEPALDRHEAQGAEHLGLGHAHDALGAGERVHLELARERADRGLGRRAVERQLTRQRRIGEQAAEQQVGVGDRGLAPAAPVAGGAGHGAGGRGPDAQRAAGVAPSDRASAGADRVDVERRQRQRPPGDGALGGLGDLAARDHAYVARGPAHVEAQHVGLAGELGQQQRRSGAACGTGEHGEGGVCARVRGLGQATR